MLFRVPFRTPTTRLARHSCERCVRSHHHDLRHWRAGHRVHSVPIARLVSPAPCSSEAPGVFEGWPPKSRVGLRECGGDRTQTETCPAESAKISTRRSDEPDTKRSNFRRTGPDHERSLRLTAGGRTCSTGPRPISDPRGEKNSWRTGASALARGVRNGGNPRRLQSSSRSAAIRTTSTSTHPLNSGAIARLASGNQVDFDQSPFAGGDQNAYCRECAELLHGSIRCSSRRRGQTPSGTRHWLRGRYIAYSSDPEESAVRGGEGGSRLGYFGRHACVSQPWPRRTMELWVDDIRLGAPSRPAGLRTEGCPFSSRTSLNSHEREQG